MRSPVRIEWRSGTLGVKLDECSTCGRVGPHRLERQYRWLGIGPIGLLPLGIRHGLECANCWAWTPMPWRDLRRGAKTRSLPIPDRPRPVTSASIADGGSTPDLDTVLPTNGVDGGTAYLGAWTVAVAILVGLALQPVGSEGVHESSSTCLVVVGLSPGQPVPTPPLIVSETLCVLPHNFEPVAKIPLSNFAPSATVPPYTVVVERTQPDCQAAFKAAFGAPSPGGPVPVIAGADPRDWSRGERFAWCMAADPKTDWPTTLLPR